MSAARGSPETETLIADAIASALLGVRGATIGIIVSYDDTTKTAKVQPAIRRPLEDDDGAIVQEADSILQNVIVAHWGSAAMSENAVLAAGDAVVLVYLDYSPALWRKRGALSDTPDTHPRRYAIAVPFLRPSGGPASDTGNSIGEPGGTRVHFESGVARVGPATDPAADFVALAAKVALELDNLKAVFTGWLPVATDGGAALKAAVTTWASNVPTDVAASKLKSG